jgi:hypothetical protein
MATHTTTTATHSEIIKALKQVICVNEFGRSATDQLDVNAAANAILAGQVTPDDNDGLITDGVEALALGALMSDGPWWTKVEDRTVVEWDTDEWVAHRLDPSDPSVTVCGLCDVVDATANVAPSWTIHNCLDCWDDAERAVLRVGVA